MSAAKLNTRNEAGKPVIVVAGDVCIDWLSIPVDPRSLAGQAQIANWQLRGGRHMYARRGGAWITADFTELAAQGLADVYKPEDRANLNSIPPSELIHSMLMLGKFPRQRGKSTVLVWGVKEFEGFAGPEDGNLTKLPRSPCDAAQVDVVVLDDAGNGFRDEPTLWPAALAENQQPIIIYKVRRPLLQNTDLLWQDISGSHLSRTIAILNADELRAEGAPISRRLSWERTTIDLVLALAHDDEFAPLKRCQHIIVPFGLEGVVHVPHEGPPRLWYVADSIESDLLTPGQGSMTAFASAFAAAFAAAVAAQPPANRLTSATVERGIAAGMLASRRLLDAAFGDCSDADGRRIEPAYPDERIFSPRPFAGFRIDQVELPRVPERTQLSQLGKFRNWRILDTIRSTRSQGDSTPPGAPIRSLAREIALCGLSKVLPDLPKAKFGALETIDRWEIESYRSIRNLLREFLKNPRPERPLCLAVFGRPGSGKSFGVTQVAKSVAERDEVEKVDLNVSQWEGVSELAVALHRVRDSALRGRVPLVFFDEFDSDFSGPLGWLKYFLAPMQDGVFSDGHLTHLVGRAVFVFAGGTCATFQQFRAAAGQQPPSVKTPDFLSRLRGHVDVFGADPLADASILRRAMLLRSFVERKYPGLLDDQKKLRIEESVLSAFLNVPEYRHGVRSIEALLEMSQLQGREQFEPSLLPPQEQMHLHTDGALFSQILQVAPRLDRILDDVAERIHQRYVEGELRGAHDNDARQRVLDRPECSDWERLDQLYQDSNRDQAAHIPIKLAAIGCEVYPLANGEAAGFPFHDGEVEKLAIMEHERWVEERRLKQPDHPGLKPWDLLSEENKQKDRDSVEGIPKLLEAANLKIVRVK